MKAKLCENGELITNGLQIYLQCKKDSEPCCFTRYCCNDRCIKMTGLHQSCKNKKL